MYPGIVRRTIYFGKVDYELSMHPWANEHKLWFIALICLSCALLTIQLFICNTIERKSGHRFIESVRELYVAFDIEPNNALAALSQEEFRAIVEECLTSLAAKVDEAQGFDKVAMRDMFNRKHAVALKWGLCHREHSKYYPKKARV